MKTVAQTVIEADRFYTIAAKGGSVIQAVEKATNGGDIRLGKYEHKPEQEWAFVREGDGVYRIRNRASGKLIDLMMTDWGLPGMNGKELAVKTRTLRPALPILLASGYAENIELPGGVQMIAKPFSIEQLRDKVKGMLVGG